MKFVLALFTLTTLVSCATQNQPAQVQVVEAVEAVDETFGRLPSSECDSSKYKTCKEARKNDIADRYMLDKNGNLYRRINKATCSITGDVQDFKISMHPKDLAVVYYKKNDNLYMINLDKEYRPSGQCPSAAGNTKLLMKNISKYTVTSNTNTTIVNAALGENHEFKAWDNNAVVYSDSDVDEFQMNECYKSEGKSFSSYVLFTKDRSDLVTKVKVNGDRKFVKDNSKRDNARYSSIGKFKDKNNVCN
jgi:hypothetical protein